MQATQSYTEDFDLTSDLVCSLLNQPHHQSGKRERERERESLGKNLNYGWLIFFKSPGLSWVDGWLQPSRVLLVYVESGLANFRFVWRCRRRRHSHRHRRRRRRRQLWLPSDRCSSLEIDRTPKRGNLCKKIISALRSKFAKKARNGLKWTDLVSEENRWTLPDMTQDASVPPCSW